MNYDAVVIGAGVMGTATARALARRGRKVLLLEQFFVGHNRGSSHGATRIFRFSYREPEFVAMAQQSLELWRELESESGETLVTFTGGFDIGSGIERNADALARCSAEFEMLEGSAASKRWPNLSFSPDEQVLFQPQGGFFAAARAIETLVASAIRSGATMHERTQAVVLEDLGDRVEVTTDAAVVTADVAIVTAGGWARDLLAQVGIDLSVRVSRESIAFFDFPHVEFPPICDWGSPTIYALPSPGQGIKAGLHGAGPTVHPDDEGGVDQGLVDQASAWVREHFPDAEPKPHFAETCLYTNTSDEQFILERHGRIVVGSPCSGHGFKFAPLIGERLADLADG